MRGESEIMNFLHHRTGLDMVKIPKQLLSQDLLDRSLRGQGPATGAKVGSPRVPNRAMKVQRYELEHAQRQAAQHDEAFTRQPSLLHRWYMLALGPFEVGVLFGLAGVAGHVLGSEAIGESPQDALEHRKQGFDTDSGTIEFDGQKGRHGQITTHQDQRTARGDGKDKAHRFLDPLPQQVESQIRDHLHVAIELALRLEKLMLIGLKDGLEFDFIAIFWGASTRL